LNYTVSLLIIMCLISGCATSSKEYLRKHESIPSIHPYQIKAVKYEKNDELQLALANWRIAEKLLIDKINSITDHIENSAEMHFQKGLTLYNTGAFKHAKKEFLKALRYDRNHEGALNYLKNRYQSSRTIIYTVIKGDTFKQIADNVYHNQNYDYIVKNFSKLHKNDTLTPGSLIMLPVINLELTKLFFNYQKEIKRARKLFHSKDYKSLLIVSENILMHNPANKEVVFMINTACYKLGQKYFKEGKYGKSIEFYERVDKSFRNVQTEISQVHLTANSMKHIATENQNYKYYYKGLELYKSKKYIEALKSLKKVETGYEAVDETIVEIKITMKKVSELHYKNGVKYFVNENLVRAISEWKKALVLNPQRKMIERDIENAMNLLEKIKKID